MDLSLSSDYSSFSVHLERLKRVARNGIEVWRGRDLQPVLGYSDWENFEAVIHKAISACKSANGKPDHHFREVTDMIVAGKGAKRQRADWWLSRGACYLVAMNADSKKVRVGYAQVYFAVQTRRQELEDQQKRVDLRIRIIDSNHQLAGTAKRAGVQRYPIFQDAGYRGLYGGLGIAAVTAKKGLQPTQHLLDHAGELELSANYFRSAVTRHRLEQERVSNESDAIQTHRSVGEEVRATIVKDKGIAPESLPVEPSIRSLVLKRKRLQNHPLPSAS